MTTPPPYYGPPPGAPIPSGRPQDGLGLAAMIIGIISIPLACCAYLGLPAGIAAIVIGQMGVRRAESGQASNRGQAMAGLVCGAIGVVLSLLVIFLGLFTNSMDFQRLVENLQNQSGN